MLSWAALCGFITIPHRCTGKKGWTGLPALSGIITDFFLYDFIYSENDLQEDALLENKTKKNNAQGIPPPFPTTARVWATVGECQGFRSCRVTWAGLLGSQVTPISGPDVWPIALLCSPGWDPADTSSPPSSLRSFLHISWPGAAGESSQGGWSLGSGALPLATASPRARPASCPHHVRGAAGNVELEKPKPDVFQQF